MLERRDHRPDWFRLSILFATSILAISGALLHQQPTFADNHIDPTTVGGGGDHATVQEALDAVLDGGTIEVAASTYTENLTVPAGLTVIIAGQGGAPADTVLAGVGASGLATMVIPATSTVTLQNLRVTGGESSGIANSGALTLSNVVVSNNTRAGDGAGGGGVRSLAGSTLSVLGGSVIEDNTVTGAGGDGGGIWSAGDTVTVTNSTVQNNTAGRTGGGIAAVGTATTLTIAGTTVSGNATQAVTDGNGGGIANAGTMSVTNSTVTGNTAANVGGGIYNTFSGTMTITGNTTISNNHADNSGGGIFNSGYTHEGEGLAGSGTVIGADVLITNNTADGDGGGIYNFGQLTITDATISSNTADDDENETGSGGGIYTLGSADASYPMRGQLTVMGATITGNAAAHGGGFHLQGGTVTLTTTTVTNNSATHAQGSGGGIFKLAPGTLTVSGGSIGTAGNGNSAFAGGGIAQQGGTTTLQDAAVVRANSANIGGGVAIGWGTLTMLGSGVIRDNTATTTGGGAWVGYSDGDTVVTGQFSLLSSTLESNTAAMGGGIFMHRGSVSLVGGTVTGNTTTDLPSAAIHNLGGGLFGYDAEFSANSSGGDPGGGQILHVDRRDEGGELIQSAATAVHGSRFPAFDGGTHWFSVHSTNGVDGGPATNAADARYNWWGSADVPTAHDTVPGVAALGNVLTDPHCLVEACTPSALVVNVTGNGTVKRVVVPDVVEHEFDCTEGVCTPPVTYGVGSLFSLTPVPAAGFVLGAWGGACDAGGQVEIILATTTAEVVCTVLFTAAPAGGGGGGGGGGAPPPVVTPTPVQDAGGVTVGVTGRQTAPAPSGMGGPARLETSANGSTARVTVPPGAIPGATEVSLGAITNIESLLTQAPPPSGTSLVLAFHVEAKDSTGNNVTDGFTEPVELEFVVPADAIPAGTSADGLMVAFWNGDSWVEVPATLTQNDDGTVTLTASVDHFTIFKVAHRPGMRSYVQPLSPNRVHFSVWGGGTISEAMTSTSVQIESLWIARDGRFYSYRVGVPAFANEAFRAHFRGDYIPGNSPLFVVTR